MLFRSSELRRIADAVDKYKIPTVKVTGGQRIDLLGVKKEDLVNVWKDIGMPSGHAYAKALRTVKTLTRSSFLTPSRSMRWPPVTLTVGILYLSTADVGRRDHGQ